MDRLPYALFVAALCIACGGSQGGGGGGDDDDDTGPDSGNPAEERAGCDGATFLGTSTDPAARGPWDVGARTVTVGRLRVEVWYPAAPGSATGETIRYETRDALGPLAREDIPADDGPWQDCDCERDLPLDEAHGPYPGVVFVHGTAAFRHQSLSQVTHWASRGFVVIAADHPGLTLGDTLAGFCPDEPSGERDLGGDLTALVDALRAPAGELAFLAGHVDAARLATTGHSAGGSTVAAGGALPGVRVVMPLAANEATAAGGDLERVLYMGGIADMVVRWTAVSSAYEDSTAPRALVGISDTGHLFCSDLCDTTNAQGQNLLEIAQEHGLCGAELAGFLFDCSDDYIEGERARAITDHATSLVLEEVLQCRTDLPALSAITDSYPEVGEVQEAP